MVNTILARRVNHIVAKGDNPAWPKGSKSRGFSSRHSAGPASRRALHGRPRRHKPRGALHTDILRGLRHRQRHHHAGPVPQPQPRTGTAAGRVDILRHGHRLQRAVPRHAILLDVSPRRQPRSARPRPASQEQGKHRGAYHRKYAAHHYRQAARGSLDHTHLHGLGRAYGV